MKTCKSQTNSLVLPMDKQMVTGHNPQADAQKTASTKGTDGKDGQEVKSQARSLFKRKSGWQMARIV